jgi:hypothetical protein
VGGNIITTEANSSIWWRDIISLGRGLVDDWFKANVRCCVGDGKNIGFWKFKWYGNQPFCELFPDLFVKESYKEVPIAERLVVNGAEPSWHWNDHLLVSEEQQLTELQNILADCSLQLHIPDTWRWVPGTTGEFSVKSCYTVLLESRQVEALDVNVLEAIKSLWKSDVPSKVNLFG